MRFRMFALLLGLITLASWSSSATAEETQREYPKLPSIREMAPTYIGTGHTQAKLIFEAILEWPIQSATSPIPGESIIQQKIRAQLPYLIGPFHRSTQAAVYGDQTVKILSKERLAKRSLAGPGIRVRYLYEGTILLDQDIASGNGFEVLLPIQLEGIYEKQKKSGKSVCTEGEDTGINYFFYHWDPRADDCNLELGTDFQAIQADFQRIDNTVQTYPEYDRLVNVKGEIDISVFFGKAEYSRKILNPRTDTDWGARDFSSFTQMLRSKGYEVAVWDQSQIRKRAPSGELPVVETYSRKFGNTTFRVTVFFGEVGLLHDSSAFHRFWEKALEQNAVVIYQGHAGVGKNLHLGKIESSMGRNITLPTDKYQLLILEACVSYSYYPRMYFARKKTTADPAGTRNLDILANGAESLFGSNEIYSVAVMRMLEEWAAGVHTWSYQELVRNGRKDFLYGINGDEDNPILPPLAP